MERGGDRVEIDDQILKKEIGLQMKESYWTVDILGEIS